MTFVAVIVLRSVFRLVGYIVTVRDLCMTSHNILYSLFTPRKSRFPDRFSWSGQTIGRELVTVDLLTHWAEHPGGQPHHDI